MRDEDLEFRQFADQLERAIARSGAADLTDAQKLARQRAQFERLTAAETEFRRRVLKHHPWAYDEFIRHVCEDNGNILTARPYFRERQAVCIGPITQALKRRDRVALGRYHANFHFVDFVRDLRPWRRDGALPRLHREVRDLRHALIVENMPLAISQARVFWSKAPAKTNDVRFSFLDFVQVAADGLASAVDKFVVPPAAEIDLDAEKFKVWRSVAVGRMKGNFIEMFNETSFHYYPRDKRKLYRANKHLKEHAAGVDIVRLAAQVNEDIAESGSSTTPEELAALMAASSFVPLVGGRAGGEDGGGTVVDKALAEPEAQPDVAYEESEARSAVATALAQLPPFDVKVLACRGVRT